MHAVVFAGNGHFLALRALEGRFHFFGKGRFGAGQRHIILGAFRAGNGGNNLAHVQFKRVGVDRGVVVAAPHAVGLGIGLDQRHAVFIAAGVAQVADSFIVDREEAAGRAIFRGHVGDGGAVCQRQAVKAVAVEFDEFADNTLFAQHFDNFQYKVGGGGALDHRAGQFEAYNLGDQHRNGLTQHRGLGLDPADAPAQNGEAIDHGGVAVGADQRVRIGDVLAVLVLVTPDGLGKVFQVDLVADSGSGRHDAEVVKGVLAPFQEGVALHVALVFAVDVHLECARIAKLVNHDRVVDNQVNWSQRIDLLRVSAKTDNAVAHGRQVDHGRDAGEILHQHTRRAVGDLTRVLAAVAAPFGKGADVIDRNRLAVFIAQHVFQHDLQRGGQAREITKAGLLGGGDGVVGNAGIACSKVAAGLCAVLSDGDGHSGLLAGAWIGLSCLG